VKSENDSVDFDEISQAELARLRIDPLILLTYIQQRLGNLRNGCYTSVTGLGAQRQIY